MKNTTLLLMLLTIFSCSSLSQNMTKEGKFTIRGSRFFEKNISEELIFKRYSWYQELTLNFDFLIAQLNTKSQFYKLFSKSEKDALRSCKVIYVALSYELNPSRLSRSELLIQIEKHGLERVATPLFSKELTMHPDFIEESLQLYQFHAFCAHEDKLEETIKFPGFSAIKIRI